MKKILITKNILGIGFNHNDCIYCGLNTNLLEQDQRIQTDHRRYCLHCYQEGVDKKRVTPADFYDEQPGLSAEDSAEYHLTCKRKCQELKGIEIAHLYGEKGEVDEMHMDMFFDREGGEIYFRLTLCDDDDPWFGTEVRSYIRPDRAIELLNKNSIHILDGLTAENWQEYFEFLE